MRVPPLDLVIRCHLLCCTATTPPFRGFLLLDAYFTALRELAMVPPALFFGLQPMRRPVMSLALGIMSLYHPDASDPYLTAAVHCVTNQDWQGADNIE